MSLSPRDKLSSAVDSVKKNAQKARDKAKSVRQARADEAKKNPEKYEQNAKKCIRGDVMMFSGCTDTQTSADVYNVASFGLPNVTTGPEKAGGACTNALLSVYKQNQDTSFGDLLSSMQEVLKQRRYSQIPQLSSSKLFNLTNQKFNIHNPRALAVGPGKKGNGGGKAPRTKALLIGINYYGQGGQLSGCVNDVKQMANFILSNGYSQDKEDLMILTDDPEFTDAWPTADNICAAMAWLVSGNEPGDSLFFHYSGHGGAMEDPREDDPDHVCQMLCPVDYATDGVIPDDLIYELLVLPLKENVQMVAVFDCCYSGTMMDLPYMFVADAPGCAALKNGNSTGLVANPFFNATAALNKVVNKGASLLRRVGENMKGVAKGVNRSVQSIGPNPRKISKFTLDLGSLGIDVIVGKRGGSGENEEVAQPTKGPAVTTEFPTPPDIVVCTGAWMSKPKAAKGGKTAGTNWNRRFVWVQNDALCYGAKQRKVEKTIPKSSWKMAQPVPIEDMAAAKAPAAHVDFGWELVCEDRVITFSAESLLSRDEFMVGLNMLLGLRFAVDSPDGSEEGEESEEEEETASAAEPAAGTSDEADEKQEEKRSTTVAQSKGALKGGAVVQKKKKQTSPKGTNKTESESTPQKKEREGGCCVVM